MTPDYKSLSRGYSRDMSPAAISKRLDKVVELHELWTFLQTGKRVACDPPDIRASSQHDNPTHDRRSLR
jgi:hypothetical protein